MTNSQVKKAIDDTIGNEPLMNEAFVQKVMDGKKKRKKQIAFLQPALVVVLMLLIGTVLYFTPQQTQQSAVEIKDYNLTDVQLTNLNNYYTAIVNEDKKVLAEIALLDDDEEEIFKRYENFDFSKQIEVVKIIETPQQFQYFVTLRTTEHMYLDHLAFDKEREKYILNMGYEISYYEQEVEFPKMIPLQYKKAPVATPVDISNIDLKKAQSERINGNTFYQLETKRGMRRIFETFAGQYYDLGIASEGISYYSVGHDNQFYFIDALTKMLTFVYLNDEGDYQILTGELEERGITNYQTYVHEEPIIITVGEQPKVMTIQKGRLVYADVLELAEFENPKAFYSIESMGSHVLVKYTEDIQQVSTYYEFTAADVLTDYRMIDVLEAKPEHLQDMILQNRYNDRIKYIFAEGTLHYRSDTRLYYEKPKSEDEKPVSGELIEQQYTNIKIETKGNQYFITGDDGFSWTLTRTAPRILQDEKGIEYAVPIAFEDLHSKQPSLIEDEIQALTMQKAQGFDIQSYTLQGPLDEITKLFKKASVNLGIVNMVDAEWLIEVVYVNGLNQKFFLWLGEEGQTSSMMKTDRLNNEYTLYTIPEELAVQFRQLIQKAE